MKNKKILFIPADVIKNEVSRSFYFARYFSENNELYFLTRLDPQNAYFENRKPSKLYTLKCFFSSLFSLTKFSKHQTWNYTLVRIPFLSHMVIHRFIGMVFSLKIARKFNAYQLKRIARKINPDLIFYAEGFDLYPCLPQYLSFSDIQDDFDIGNFRDNEYNRNYAKKNVLKSKINFVVSRQAAINLGNLYNCKFEYIPNGVDLNAILNVDQREVETIREKIKLKGKFVISYIGADAWYDIELLKELSNLASKFDSSIHFLIIGNLPKIDAENITFTGAVSKEESYFYYWMSDLGILLKDSKGSNFLRNSIPLKIVQYGVLGKHFLSPPISWLEEEKFKNVSLLNNYDAQSIMHLISQIMLMNKTVIDSNWNEYDWRKIVESMLARIEMEINKSC